MTAREQPKEQPPIAPPTLSPSDANIIARGVIKALAVWTLLCAVVGGLIWLAVSYYRYCCVFSP
jgi:hypothetical protein